MKKYASVKKCISEYKLTIPSNMIIKTKTKTKTIHKKKKKKKKKKEKSQLTDWGFVYKFRLLKAYMSIYWILYIWV